MDGTHKNLFCKSRPTKQTRKQIPGCSSDATSVEFGYENPIKQNTIVIGEACYNEHEGRTIFVHTKSVRDGDVRSAALKTESVNYLAQSHSGSRYHIHFLMALNLDLLKERLKKLLSTNNVPYLEPRRLIDLPILQNGQLNTIMNLGWNDGVTSGYFKLPNYDLLIKDIMTLNDSSFDLYFGTHSVLSMQTESKGAVDVYLIPDEHKYPVPKYFWVAVTTKSGKAAGFLVSNDINANIEELISNPPCESKCSQMTWMSNLLNEDAYKKPKNGFVTCCELNSFKNKVNEMPSIEGKYDLLT